MLIPNGDGDRPNGLAALHAADLGEQVRHTAVERREGDDVGREAEFATARALTLTGRSDARAAVAVSRERR